MTVSTLRPQPVDATPYRMMRLAVPMTLAHITEPLLGLVDTAAIGRLGEVSLLGAVAIGAIVFDFLFWGLGSLRMSTAGLTAQALGAGSERDIRLILARALALAALLGLVLIVLRAPLADLAMFLLSPGPAVREAALVYIGYRIWAAPFALANYAVLGSLIGRGRTDLGLAVQVGINLTKVSLAILLVAVMGYGLAGAAIGTLIAECIGTLGGMAILARLGSFRETLPLSEIMAPVALRRLLAVNGDIIIRTLALLTAFGFFTSYGARSGDVTLAANQVLNNLFLLSGYFLDGFATAAEQMCGQAIGAQDRTGFKKSVSLALIFSVGTGAFMSLIVLAFGGAFIDFVTANADIRAFAHDYLFYAALTPLAGSLAFAFDGIYIGSTWTREMRNLMLLSLAVCLTVLNLTTSLNNTGLWLSLLSFLVLRGLGQALLYPKLVRKSFAQAVT